jgi:hypothetical protein
MPQSWVVNATQAECMDKYLNNATFKMGINQTYDLTASLFFLIGMLFGQSYSV